MIVSRRALEAAEEQVRWLRAALAAERARSAALTETIATMVASGATAAVVPKPDGTTAPRVAADPPEFAPDIEAALVFAGKDFGEGALPAMRAWVREAVRAGVSEADIVHRVLHGEREEE